MNHHSICGERENEKLISPCYGFLQLIRFPYFGLLQQSDSVAVQHTLSAAASSAVCNGNPITRSLALVSIVALLGSSSTDIGRNHGAKVMKKCGCPITSFILQSCNSNIVNCGSMHTKQRSKYPRPAVFMNHTECPLRYHCVLFVMFYRAISIQLVQVAVPIELSPKSVCLLKNGELIAKTFCGGMLCC